MLSAVSVLPTPRVLCSTATSPLPFSFDDVVKGLASLCLGKARLHTRLNRGLVVIRDYERVGSAFLPLDVLDAADSGFKPELLREGEA